MTEQARTITLDGTSYEIGQFSEGIQNAIGIYNTFSTDLQKEQLAVMKTQAAMQTIGAQIGEAVKAELAAKEAKVGDADAADTAADAKGQDA